ncbi:MAG TPA: AAA family ATPase [Methylomirabilota bacterium]|nr:AAA family ATPase [Methylomirabilota bacterium]
MICPQCQHEASPDAAFCDECGTRLEAACPNCGEPNRRSAKFCRNCGQGIVQAGPTTPSTVPAVPPPDTHVPRHLAEKILASRHTLEGERKQVTVLFADIKGSTKLLEGIDPEEGQKLIDPVLRVMMDAVHRYEGTVNQVLGDGIMALFGAPLAHEDHALRACYAALAMQEEMRRHRRKLGQSEEAGLQIGIGLNSGEVVVRSIDNDLNIDYSALGHTTHLAARMQELSGPGTTLMTASTLRQVEGFVQIKSIGAVQVKGVSRPIEAFEVFAATTARTRVQAAAVGGLTPLVGRRTEIEVFNKLVEQAEAGRGQVLALVGEPGMGKSRLVHEFTRHQLRPGWLVLEGASVSYGKATPYFPLIEMLRHYFQIADGEVSENIRDQVVMHILDLDNRLKDAIPPILSLLGVLPDETLNAADGDNWGNQLQDLSEMINRFNSMDPQQRRRHTLEAVKRVVIRESQRQPLLTVFEDLHWVDTETNAFLDSLTDSLPMARILVLVNYRPGYVHNWNEKTFYTQLRVDPLQPTSAEELLQHLLGRNEDLAPLKELLIRRTEGNPFFAEESVRSLVETGVLVGEKRAYRPGLKIDEIRIPSTVQNVVADRIDRLPIEEKRLLQTAAVIGVIVPLPLLRAVAALPEDELQSYLAHLQSAEFLYETKLFPQLEYNFKHALTNEVAYGALLHDRRTSLHALIVNAIEILDAGNLQEKIEQLAHHAFCGELWEKAVLFQRQAGSKAVARSANVEAVLFFERALVALNKWPDSREKLEHAVDLRLELRNALFLLGEFERLYHYLQEAEALAETLGDQRRLGSVLNFMISYFVLMGNHQRATEIAQRALNVGDRDLSLNVVTHYYLGVAYHHMGRYRDSMSVLTRAIANVDNANLRYERFGTANIISVICRVWKVQCLAQLGAFQDGLRDVREAIRIAEESKHPYSLAYAHCSQGLLLLVQGEIDEAIRVLEGCTKLCQLAEIRVLFPQTASYLGLAYALAGRLDEAIPLMEKADEETGLIGRKAGQSLRIAWHGYVNLLAGRIDEAKKLAERAFELSQESHEEGHHAWTLKLLGDIAASNKSSDNQAEIRYGQALALSRKLEMIPLQAHLSLALGQFYFQNGDATRARSELARALGLYRESEMKFWQTRVEAALGELPGPL